MYELQRFEPKTTTVPHVTLIHIDTTYLITDNMCGPQYHCPTPASAYLHVKRRYLSSRLPPHRTWVGNLQESCHTLVQVRLLQY